MQHFRSDEEIAIAMDASYRQSSLNSIPMGTPMNVQMTGLAPPPPHLPPTPYTYTDTEDRAPAPAQRRESSLGEGVLSV